jgi:hypothetical protein
VQVEDDDGIYRPDPPPVLKGTPGDYAAIEEMAKRLGWRETLYIIGQTLEKYYKEATGTRKGSIRAVCNHINFIMPGASWCDEE